MKELSMPVLKPITIPTKKATYLVALWRWLTSIRRWELQADWYWYFDTDNIEVIVPAGYIFDGASIPRIFWFVLSPTGLLLIPGLIHDYAYEHDYILTSAGDKYRENAGRFYWDRVFRDTAIKINGFHIINYMAWFALVLGGWAAWWSHRRRGNEVNKDETI